MRLLAAILIISTVAAAQEPDVPCVRLSVVELAPVNIGAGPLAVLQNGSDILAVLQNGSDIAEGLNILANFEAGPLARLTRHNSRPENHLHAQIRFIREIAKTDPERAAALAQQVIDQFKGWGVDL